MRSFTCLSLVMLLTFADTELTVLIIIYAGLVHSLSPRLISNFMGGV